MDALWERQFRIYFSDLYHWACLKAIPRLSWEQLFTTVSLWSHLEQAKTTVKEFSIAKDHSDSNINFQVLRDGIIGVLKKGGVVYYNVDTLQQLQELTLNESFDCRRYSEDDNMIVILDAKGTLYIKRKDNRKRIAGVIYRVLYFIILKDIIYYVTYGTSIYKCVFVDGVYESTCLVREYEVLGIGHENDVFHFTAKIHNRTNFYVIENDTVKMVSMNASKFYQSEALRKYNYANDTDWSNTFCRVPFFDEFTCSYPQTRNILIMRTHGPVLLAGYFPGIIRIFHSLYTTPVVKLLQEKPIKLYFVLESQEQRTPCNILNMDVVEGEYSHTVLVAMAHKMLAIKFTHPSSGMQSSAERPSGSEKPSVDKQSTGFNKHTSSATSLSYGETAAKIPKMSE